MVAINRIVFMGTPEFAVPSLQVMLERGENVVCVVTQPDRPRGRGRKVLPPPVKILALHAKIQVLQPDTLKGADFLAKMKQLAPDVIIVAAYGKILPGSIIDTPPLGTLNVHGSLLPKYRGAAPIQWALINGEKETGVTIMQMDRGIDTGDILLQEKVAIAPDDTAGTLSIKMAEIGGKTLGKAIDLLRADKLKPVKQDDTQASFAPLLSKEKRQLNWSQTAEQISCLIRGLDPWPATYTMLSGKRIRLFSPRIIPLDQCDTAPMEPGTVCGADKNGLVIATGQDCLLVEEIQAEGSRRLKVDAFISGHPIPAGARLGQ
jgi:methionyl-tRNA formyltransferase